jgi:hypothetical protein
MLGAMRKGRRAQHTDEARSWRVEGARTFCNNLRGDGTDQVLGMLQDRITLPEETAFGLLLPENSLSIIYAGVMHQLFGWFYPGLWKLGRPRAAVQYSKGNWARPGVALNKDEQMLS